MDSFSDPRVYMVVFMAAAQVGKTQSLLNCIGYIVDQDPCPFMIVYPTVDTAREWSTERLAPMIRDTKCLGAAIADEKSRSSSNKQLVKTFRGGYMSIVGANSPASLASKPMRIVFLDEVNRFPLSAGDEGDPVRLAGVRTKNFWNRTIYASSTPTNKQTGRIEKLYAISDQRKFYVPCVLCDHGQILKWDQIIFDKTGTLDERARSARYFCEQCDEPWSDAQRWRGVSRGEWIAQKEFSGTAGFWLNEWYSPWVTIYESVKGFLEVKDDPLELKTWINTSKAESWEEEAEAPKWRTLWDRLEDYPLGEPPAGAMFLTAGVDVQRDRLEASIWAWGVGKESWLVDHRVLPGDTALDATWNSLTPILGETWQTEDGRTLPMSRLAIDSGYRATEVYGWAFGKAPGRVMVVKGNDDSTAILGQPKGLDFNRRGKRINRSVKVWPVGTGAIKQETYGWFDLKRPVPVEGEPPAPFPKGYIHLTGHVCDEEACRQFTAEKLVLETVRGYEVRRWQKDRLRNEMLDCRVYARAAAESLGLGRGLAERLAAQLLEGPRSVDDGETMPPGRATRGTGRRISGQGRRVR